MRLAVVIVTYNRINLLKECIDACVSQSYPFEEILIVDNASNDGTKEYIDNLQNPIINKIHLPENTGGSGGFYVGCEYFQSSQYDWVLLIDDDAILDKDYNYYIVNEMKNKKEGIVGFSGTVITDDKIQYSHRRFLKKTKIFEEYDSNINDYNKEFFDYDICSFCGLYVPIDIISKIGLPEKDYFIWYDDTEYSLRLSKIGRIRNVNKSKLNHKTTLIRNKTSEVLWKEYYGRRNMLYSVKKHFSEEIYINTLRKSKEIQVRYYIRYFVTRKAKFLKYYNLFTDAINDAESGHLGKNPKYLPSVCR